MTDFLLQIEHCMILRKLLVKTTDATYALHVAGRF